MVHIDDIYNAILMPIPGQQMRNLILTSKNPRLTYLEFNFYQSYVYLWVPLVTFRYISYACF